MNCYPVFNKKISTLLVTGFFICSGPCMYAITDSTVTVLSFNNYNSNSEAINYFSPTIIINKYGSNKKIKEIITSQNLTTFCPGTKEIYFYNASDSLIRWEKVSVNSSGAETLTNYRSLIYNSSGYLINDAGKYGFYNDSIIIYRDQFNRDTLSIHYNGTQWTLYSEYRNTYVQNYNILSEQIFSLWDTSLTIWKPHSKYCYAYDSLLTLMNDTIYLFNSQWYGNNYHNYYYDLSNRLIKKEEYSYSFMQLNYCTTWNYNLLSQLISVSYSYGSCSSGGLWWTNMDYNGAGKILNTVHTENLNSFCQGWGNVIINSDSNEYDIAGLLAKEKTMNISLGIPCSATLHKTEKYYFYSPYNAFKIFIFRIPGYTKSCADSAIRIYALNINGVKPINYKWNHPQYANVDSAKIDLKLENDYLLKVTATDSSGISSSDSLFFEINSLHEYPLWCDKGVSNIHICKGNYFTLANDSSHLSFPEWNYSGVPVPGTDNMNAIIINKGGLITCTSIFNDGTDCPHSAFIQVTEEGPLPEIKADENIPLPLSPGQRTTLRDKNGNRTLTYEWYKNGIIVENVADTFLVVSSPGKYSFVVTATNGCSALSEELEINISGNIEGSGIFYNQIAANGILTFYIDPLIVDLNKKMTFEIFDSAGKIFYKNGLTSQVSSFFIGRGASGIYYLRIFNNEKNIFKGKIML